MTKVKDADVFGPLSRDEFQALVDAPYGTAVRAIREHDPLFRREPGEKIEWLCRFSRVVDYQGEAYVWAETEEEARKRANALPEEDIEWVSDPWFARKLETVEAVT